MALRTIRSGMDISILPLVLLAVIAAESAFATPPAAPGPTGSAAAQPSGGKGQDLSGVWQVRLTGTLVGPSLLCQAVPPLNMSWRDTVLSAHNLRELLYAVVPDSARTWFDRVCAPRFSGDQVAAACRIPLTYAKPCILTSNMTFHGAVTGGIQFTGKGQGDVTLGGPGLCPEASCPGEIDLVATRVGPVPAGAASAPVKSR
jgi:hypothetical protein